MPPNLPSSLRQWVIERAAGCCEYCLIHQDDVPQQHEIDHLIARKHGGQTVVENLVLACLPCNRYKGTDLTAIDPETLNVAPLFNPRAQIWDDHFSLIGARILGLTPTGRATVALLRFNI
ncbi:MAG: HNH endonuclease, partial [Chloroflexota bacterium]|nr:HNH endonuclease [Chloroflexota bacterium]